MTYNRRWFAAIRINPKEAVQSVTNNTRRVRHPKQTETCAKRDVGIPKSKGFCKTQPKRREP